MWPHIYKYKYVMCTKVMWMHSVICICMHAGKVLYIYAFINAIIVYYMVLWYHYNNYLGTCCMHM